MTLSLILSRVDIPLKSVDKIEMIRFKVNEQHFAVVLLITLHKVAQK